MHQLLRWCFVSIREHRHRRGRALDADPEDARLDLGSPAGGGGDGACGGGEDAEADGGNGRRTPLLPLHLRECWLPYEVIKMTCHTRIWSPKQ